MTNKTSEASKTRTIKGHKMTFTSGERYIASRPMATRGRKFFDVNIRKVDAPLNSEPLLILPDLTYDAANEFLAAFNNGATSFEGRVW